MDELRIVDHDEWWITFEDKLHPEHHGIYLKVNDEQQALRILGARRKASAHQRWACHKVHVVRTAEKLDW